MKRTLAALLAALTFLGPLPSYAQSVPQAAGTGQVVGLPAAAAGVAGPSSVGLSPGAPGALLTRPTLGLPAPAAALVPAVAARAATSAAATASVEVPHPNTLPASRGEGERGISRQPAAVAEAAPAGTLERRQAIGSARRLAGSFDARASAVESSERASTFFDALRRASRDGAQAAADEAPQAEPAPQAQAPAPKAAVRAEAMLRSFGRKVASSALGRLLPAGVASRLAGPEAEPPAPKKPSNTDEWGGPKSEAMTLKGQALYGLKWALNLVGITTLLSLTLGPLVAVTPWQLYVPDFLLQMSGRVELLVNFGPQAIMDQLAASPLGFFFLKVPIAVAGEELSFRLLGFAKNFLLLAAARPVAGWIAEKLGALPNLFNIVSLFQRLLGRLGRVSGWAFPIAAALSASSFALAHVGEWGFDPFVLAVQAIAGLALARTAYVSRGLVAPFTAHLAFTLLTLAAPALVVAGLVGLGSTMSILVGLAGVVALFYNVRVHQKLSKAPAALGVIFLAAVMGLSAAGGPRTAGQAVQSLGLVRPSVTRLQGPAPQPHLQLPAELLQALGVAADPAAGQPDLSLPDLVRAAKPAVVTVMTPHGLGSGFIIETEGLLVTNAHVVESVGVGAIVKIRFADGMEAPAKVLGMNTERDLALVGLPPNPQGWPHVPLAPAGSLVEGQKVVTMGSPLGLPFTVSDGIVSGLGFRGIGMVYRVQITAPISHGNSGGPLFDMKGRVVGVNSAGIEQGANLGFAIPVEEVSRAVAQFKATGEIRSSHLGIILQVGKHMTEGPGVTVEHVRPGSPADKAGLLPGDVVVGADGQRFAPAPMPALNGLLMRLGAKNPGDELEFLVLRPQASGIALPTVVKVTVDAK